MIVIKLPWKDRKVVSEVAKLYMNMAIHGEGYDDRIRQFWRISMYVKVGLLSKNDVETIITAMEAFHNFYQNSPTYKDPDGSYTGLDRIIPKMKALLA